MKVVDNNKNRSVKPPKLKGEHISFMMIIMTLFIALSAFWQFQIRIWNRVEYNVGPWRYNLPFYDSEKYPNQEYLELMLNRALLFAIMSIVFNIALIIYVSSTIKKSESNQSLGIVIVLSAIMTLVSFWNLKSLFLAPNQWFSIALDRFDSSRWKFAGIALPGSKSEETRFNFLRILFKSVLRINYTVFVSLIFLLVKRMISDNLNLFLQRVGIFFLASICIGVLNLFLKWIDFPIHPIFSMLIVISAFCFIWILTQQNKGLAFKSVVFYWLMSIFFVYTIIPVVYTLGLSMSSNADINANRFTPSDPVDNMIINYSSVIFILNGERAPSFGSSFLISLGLGFGTAIGGLIITLPAAYAISRFKFKGKGWAQFLVIATQMFPGIILLLPQFFFWKQLGFLDAENPDRLVLGVLLAYFVGALAYNIWMMKGYFDTLPRDLEEAALIDGSSTFGAFIKIAIPLAAPGMVAVSIFTFLGAWNEFALAQVFIGEGKKQATLPLLFYQYQDTSAPDNPPFFQLLSAFSILAALPIVVLFLALQKYLASGLTTGGVK